LIEVCPGSKVRQNARKVEYRTLDRAGVIRSISEQPRMLAGGIRINTPVSIEETSDREPPGTCKEESRWTSAGVRLFDFGECWKSAGFGLMYSGTVAIDLNTIPLAEGLVRWDGWPRTLPLNTSLRHHPLAACSPQARQPR